VWRMSPHRVLYWAELATEVGTPKIVEQRHTSAMRLSQERRNGALTPWRSYEWSVDDRLLAVVLNAEASGGNQAPRVTYGYHHSGTRVARSAVDGEALPAYTPWHPPRVEFSEIA
jgi:hypothetical protein